MKFTPRNVDRATVFDVDTKEQLKQVLMVNTETSSVVVAKQPLRLNHKGSVERETIHFNAIYPIYGGGTVPCLFHCYGRQP